MSKIDEDKLLIIILGVVIAVLILAGGIIGCFFYRRYQSKSEIDEINCTNIFADTSVLPDPECQYID